VKILRTIMLVALITLLATPVARSEFTAEEWQRMKNGDVIITEVAAQNPDGSQRIDFLAKLYIKATRQEVWKTIRDYNHYSEFMPRLTKATILKQEGQVYWVRYEVKVLWLRVVYHLRVEGVDPFKRIEFKLDTDKKNHIRNTYGYWILQDAPEGSGTVLSYSAYIDTGIPAPESLARKVAKSALPGVVKNVRKRIESGGTWKKAEGS